MKYETLESDDSNETLDPCDTKTVKDSAHEEQKTATEGKPLVKKKYGSTIEDDETANLFRMMLNSMGATPSDASKVKMPDERDPEDPAAKYF
jgi:hypothetical protein